MAACACGQELPTGRGGPRKYCSATCRERAKYASSERVPCVVCGGPTGWKTGTREQATCNPCRSNYARFEHGSRRGYRDAKCRCDACTEWNRIYNQGFRDKRRAEGRPIKRFGSSGPWIAPATRLGVFDRDNWTCQLCGEPVQPDADPQSDWYPSLDHIVPQSAGGGHDAENLRTAHRWCNSIRGAKDYHADLFVGVP